MDADQDGYSSDVDCDDADGTVHPNADERCDGIDNNCDGMADEWGAIDGTLYYADVDKDGFGDDHSRFGRAQQWRATPKTVQTVMTPMLR